MRSSLNVRSARRAAAQRGGVARESAASGGRAEAHPDVVQWSQMRLLSARRAGTSWPEGSLAARGWWSGTHTVGMRSVIRLKNVLAEPLPAHLAADEVRFPAELVRVFLEEHTRAGDVVLDPFAGYGTTLRTAEDLGRAGYGVELDE